MIVFYSSPIHENKAVLDEEEFRHCFKVLRHKSGNIIHITNGKGILAKAQIVHVGSKKAELEIISKQSYEDKQHKIIVGIAPPKNRSRWEWFLEKSVEIGVDSIIPFASHNSERVKINLERNRKIIRSAALQSLRHFHPEIKEMIKLEKLMSMYKTMDVNKLVAHYNPENIDIHDVKNNFNDTIILIGPEGDFSDVELTNFAGADFIQVNVSSNRLRTETAGIVSVSQLTNKISE